MKFYQSPLKMIVLTLLGSKILLIEVTTAASIATYTPISDDLTKSGQVTFSEMAVEVYVPPTDEPTGKYAVFKRTGGVEDAMLDVLPGFFDIIFPSQDLEYDRTIEITLPIDCTKEAVEGDGGLDIPVYSAAEGMLCLPRVKVGNVGILPNGALFELPPDCYTVRLAQSATQPQILKMEYISEISSELCN